ncbi:MAG: metallophosphoesterase [Christensenellales bacterium]|jgi:predicted phosphohydrolase
MNIYAVSDLHLSGAAPKAMDIFGDHWRNHFEQIKSAWLQAVGEDDVVLIAGDISWAMHLSDAKVDLDAIGALPGKKIMIRGNHDFWWGSISRVRAALAEGTYALQNDSVTLGASAFAGSRGWTCPGGTHYTQEDEKIYNRELMRLEMSLAHAAKSQKPIIGMIHYPPFNERQEPSGFTELFERFEVRKVVYGHLHGASVKSAFNGVINGVQYILTSCDAIGFAPKRIQTAD